MYRCVVVLSRSNVVSSTCYCLLSVDKEVLFCSLNVVLGSKLSMLSFANQEKVEEGREKNSKNKTVYAIKGSSISMDIRPAWPKKLVNLSTYALHALPQPLDPS